MEPILGQGWTLYYEMMFYAVFGITLVLPRFLGVAVSAGLFISIAVADIVCRAIGEAPKLNHLVLFYSHYIILLFVGGMVIGIIEKKRARTNGIIRHPALISTALMTICIIHFYIFDRLTGLRPASEALYFVLATCVVAVCVFGDRITYRGAMATLVLVGEYSYAIYLTHNFFVYAYASALTHWVGGLNLPFFAPGIVVIAIIIGWLTFKVVEKPILTVLNRGLVRFNVNLRVVRLTSIFSRKDKGKD
jgi:exopolysaccharide production protein ExoZ